MSYLIDLHKKILATKEQVDTLYHEICELGNLRPELGDVELFVCGGVNELTEAVDIIEEMIDEESTEFDREQAIEYLSQCDYDYIINGHEGGLELLWSYLGDGFKGYQNFTDEELKTEVAQRKEMTRS